MMINYLYHLLRLILKMPALCPDAMLAMEKAANAVQPRHVH